VESNGPLNFGNGGSAVERAVEGGGSAVEAVEGVEKTGGGRAVERGCFHRLKSHTLTRHFGAGSVAGLARTT
jgi:hypothetical protein